MSSTTDQALQDAASRFAAEVVQHLARHLRRLHPDAASVTIVLDEADGTTYLSEVFNLDGAPLYRLGDAGALYSLTPKDAQGGGAQVLDSVGLLGVVLRASDGHCSAYEVRPADGVDHGWQIQLPQPPTDWE
ncbi:hypothetical protein ABZS76_32965 [Streptomyces sp. NPDC005562]|uniref:hypothetical protein n=1 Tax=Streptomyces sp. NPDC005562 TaxID=3154890 RepID=UPI0033AC3E4A